jgi:hypothetical protein
MKDEIIGSNGRGGVPHPSSFILHPFLHWTGIFDFIRLIKQAVG